MTPRAICLYMETLIKAEARGWKLFLRQMRHYPPPCNPPHAKFTLVSAL